MDSFERTIPAAVFEAAARHADRPAIVSGGEVITYEGLLDRALRAAAVLAHGVSGSSSYLVCDSLCPCVARMDRMGRGALGVSLRRRAW